MRNTPTTSAYHQCNCAIVPPRRSGARFIPGLQDKHANVLLLSLYFCGLWRTLQRKEPVKWRLWCVLGRKVVWNIRQWRTLADKTVHRQLVISMNIEHVLHRTNNFLTKLIGGSVNYYLWEKAIVSRKVCRNQTRNCVARDIISCLIIWPMRINISKVRQKFLFLAVFSL